MRRREFITFLGSAAALPSLLPTHTARAQQPTGMRRIGVLTGLAADDPEGQARNAAFLQGLERLGWTVGRNVRVDYRWSASDPDRVRRFAGELLALAPDVILANGTTVMGPLQQVTRSVPIVFVQVGDPVGAGFVESLARPGGNATGFTSLEYGMASKHLQLLKEIAPRLKRVAVLRDPTLSSGSAELGAVQAVAPSLGMLATPIGVRDAGEIQRGVTAFARAPNGGLIVLITQGTITHRELIITLAARLSLPAIYASRFFITDGGLISYGPDSIDPFRQAAGYVDRILKGEKPADLPVQAPVKYETVLNMKTAKALGIEVPATVLVRADAVIE